jgi:HD-GYP domain-containing protein (c-di-GMP phosphodiesterase class II)
LIGDAIPIGSRIISVCNAFDAMTSDRPYRLAITPQDALAELERASGTQFDPDVVAAFTATLNEPATGQAQHQSSTMSLPSRLG